MLGIRVWIKKKLSLLWMGKLFAMYFHLTQWRRERCVIMCVNVCLCTNEQLTMLLNLFIDTLHSWIHNHPGLRCRWKHTAYKSRQKGALWDTTWNTLKHTKNMFVCCFTPGVNWIVFLQPFFFFSCFGWCWSFGMTIFVMTDILIFLKNKFILHHHQ